MIFDLGAQQKKWLDYLWYHNNIIPFKVCREWRKKSFTSWLSIQEVVCPIDHRKILKGERLIEFDSDNRDDALDSCQAIVGFLKKLDYPFYIQDHNGRSPHIHVFGLPDIGIDYLQDIDNIKFDGSGLCRAVGGRYYKKDKIYRASFFQSLDEIKTVIKKEEVRFPWHINL